MINMSNIASGIDKYSFFNMNYVNFASQCGLLNREKGKKLLKLQVGLLRLIPSCKLRLSKSAYSL